MTGGRVVGLLAGAGRLPGLILRDLRSRGGHVALVSFEGIADPALAALADVHAEINPGKVGAIIKFLRKHDITHVAIAGKVPKAVLLKPGGLKPDLRALGVLMKLKDFRDDTILSAIDREFQREGFTVLGLGEIAPGLLTPSGTLTSTHAAKHAREDIDFGFRMAKEIGRLDIGQTVVVKNRVVVAVEAVEGTDEAIRRGGHLAGDGAVVVKVSRPGQSMRFDLPTVGLETLEIMRAAGISALATEAQRSLLLDREAFLSEADKSGIAIVGIEGTRPTAY